jgi:hypothetical protein
MSEGRDTNGRFKHGNPGNPNAKGRPKRVIERQYLTAMAETVTRADWVEIIRRAIQDAKVGDSQARAWLSKHLTGEESLVALAILDDLEELKAEGDRLERERARDQQRQQHEWHPRRGGSLQEGPRRLAGDDRAGGADHADGAGGADDQADDDGLRPLF